MPATVLAAPTDVVQSVDVNKNITATWGDVPAAAGYDVQVVDPLIGTPFSNPSILAKGTTSTSITPTTTWPTTWQNDFQVQVRARSVATGTDPSPSLWAGAFTWSVNPSITVVIGGQALTLTRVPDVSGSQKFKLIDGPPIVVTVADLKSYISTLAAGLGLPTLSGVTFGDDNFVTISRFTISTGGFFDLDLTYSLGVDGWQVFPGFKVMSLGLAVLHSDATTAGA